MSVEKVNVVGICDKFCYLTSTVKAIEKKIQKFVDENDRNGLLSFILTSLNSRFMVAKINELADFDFNDEKNVKIIDEYFTNKYFQIDDSNTPIDFSKENDEEEHLSESNDIHTDDNSNINTSDIDLNDETTNKNVIENVPEQLTTKRTHSTRKTTKTEIIDTSNWHEAQPYNVGAYKEFCDFLTYFNGTVLEDVPVLLIKSKYFKNEYKGLDVYFKPLIYTANKLYTTFSISDKKDIKTNYTKNSLEKVEKTEFETDLLDLLKRVNTQFEKIKIEEVINTDFIFDFNKLIVKGSMFSNDYKYFFNNDNKKNVFEYTKIFSLLNFEKWNFTLCKQICKNIFEKRRYIINHERVQEHVNEWWEIAKRNINETKNEDEITNQWKMTLNSEQAKLILCHNYPNKVIFDKHIKMLLNDKKTYELFKNELLTISFIFTPFCIQKPVCVELKKKTKTYYIDFLKGLFKDAEMLNNYEECYWCGVLLNNNKDDVNTGLCLTTIF